MKFATLTAALLFSLSCSNATIMPTCDTEGVVLNHNVINGAAATARGVAYHISISIDGNALTAIADTGSSNLIVQQGFSASTPSLGTFSITYGGGSATLDAYTGQVNLNCQQGVKNFQYGVIQAGSSTNQSILGLAYKNSIESTLPGEKPFPTFMTQLTDSPSTLSDEFSMLLCGYGNDKSRITFGGLPNFAKSLNFQNVQIVEKSWYVINARQVSAGGTNFGDLSQDGSSVIVDSGTTLNLLPSNVTSSIISYLSSNYPHAANWTAIQSQASAPTPISCPSQSDISQMPNINIALDNNVTLSIAPNTYFKKISGGQCFFGFANQEAGSPIILGQVTMENYMVRFDRTNSQIGFAKTNQCST